MFKFTIPPTVSPHEILCIYPQGGAAAAAFLATNSSARSLEQRLRWHALPCQMTKANSNVMHGLIDHEQGVRALL